MRTLQNGRTARLAGLFVVQAAAAASIVGAVPPAQAGQCPPELTRAQRLLLVTTPSFNTFRGTIATYRRNADGNGWSPVGSRRPIVVGRKGLAWGWTAQALARPGEPFKREGDKRAPAGVFDIGSPFGTTTADLPDFVRLRRGEHFCVDDTRSRYYGQIVPRKVAGRGISGEEMAKIGLYRRGLFVNYPPNAAKRAGSCIFVHVWRRPDSPTVGCVAASEIDVSRLQSFAAGQGTAIAILPETTLDRLQGCLPDSR